MGWSNRDVAQTREGRYIALTRTTAGPRYTRPSTRQRRENHETADRTVEREASMTDTDSAVTDLEARVTAMRRLGVTRWADIELGPEPAQADDTSREDATQRSMKLDAENRERAYRLRFGASGGPRPLGGNR